MSKERKIQCPYCESDKIKSNGYQKNGKKRYKCNEKGCGKTFQEFLPYDAKRFFSTLYKLIEEDDENRISFQKDEIDKFLPKFANKTKWREIVIKEIPDKLKINSYNPKIAIVYENETQIQIFKFKDKIGSEKCYKFEVWDQNNKRGVLE